MKKCYISNKLRGGEVISLPANPWDVTQIFRMTIVALHPISCRLNPQYLSIKNSLYKTFVTFVFLARFPNSYVIIRCLITLRTGSKAQEHRLGYDKKLKQYKTKQKKNCFLSWSWNRNWTINVFVCFVTNECVLTPPVLGRELQQRVKWLSWLQTISCTLITPHKFYRLTYQLRRNQGFVYYVH